MIIHHIYKDNKIKALTLYNILIDKPDRLYWINNNIYTPVVIKIEKKKLNDHSVTVYHSGSFSSTGESRIEETVEDYLEKTNPTFKNGVAFLVANNAYDDSDRKIYVDFYSDNWNKTTTSIKEVNNNANNFNWCCIRSDLEFPVVYYGSRSNIDFGALALMEKFSNLSYMEKVPPTAVATDFMLRYIIESDKLNVKARKEQLFLLERKNYKRVLPKYLNTDSIADLWVDFYYWDSNNRPMRNTSIPPTLEDILFKEGLDYVTEPIVITKQSIIPEVEYIRITSAMAFFYVLSSEDKDFSSKKRVVNAWLEGSELRKDEYSIIQIDAIALNRLKKETSDVSV